MADPAAAKKAPAAPESKEADPLVEPGPTKKTKKVTEAAGRRGIDRAFDAVDETLKPKPEAPAAETVPAPVDEIDSIQEHAKGSFRQLKDIGKAKSSELKMLRSKIAPLMQELRSNQIPGSRACNKKPQIID